jgi:hypothetical protein
MLFLFVLTFLMASAQASEIRTHRFSTYDGYAPGDAAREYDVREKEIEEAVKKEMRRSTCEIAGKKVPCLIGRYNYERVILPPFIPALPSDLDGYFVDGLVPMKEVLGGDSAISDWWSKAHMGQPYNCGGDGDCRIIVHTPTRGLAECYVTKTSAGLGAPKYCHLIAVRENGVWFLNSIVDWNHTSAHVGRRDFDIAIEGKLAKAHDIYKILMSALASQPLNLSVEQQSNGDVVGVASYRSSKVLKDWREVVTIRLQVEGKAGKPDGTVRDRKSTMYIYVISTLYVNRQNSSKPSDWSLPTQVQESLWMSAVRINLKQSLPKLCNKSSWKDDRILACR